MINIAIKDARVVERTDGGFYVEHPQNDAILAYCDTNDEAKAVVSVLNDLAAQIENILSR